MKEFVKTVKQTFQASGSELLGFNIISLLGGIVGIVIILIIMAADNTTSSYVTAGAVMVIIFGMMLILFGGLFSLQQDFNLAISLGKTRKHYVPARFLLLACNSLLCVIISCVFGCVEEFLYGALYPGMICEFNMNDILWKPVVILCFVFIVPMVILLGGALFLKFGAKFGWVFWVIWMVCCTGIPRTITATKDNPDSVFGKIGAAIISFFTQITEAQALITVLVMGVVGLVAAFLLLRKQRVTL